jgi:Arc/MetJ-type ribon-helix-helix transcriptional regulator
MKIVTVNLREEMIDRIKVLTGTKGLYPSRSELLRVAVREFLIRQITAAKACKQHKEKSQKASSPKRKFKTVEVYAKSRDGDRFTTIKQKRLINSKTHTTRVDKADLPASIQEMLK